MCYCCRCYCCRCRSRLGPPGPQGKQGPPGPPGPLDMAYGSAYSSSVHTNTGTIPLTIAGPLHDVIVRPEQGLQVLRSGIYQISYNVTLAQSTNAQAEFRVFINGTIQVPSLVTQSQSSNTVSSTTLFSLLAKDIVQLDATLPTNASFRMPTLQVVQVG